MSVKGGLVKTYSRLEKLLSLSPFGLRLATIYTCLDGLLVLDLGPLILRLACEYERIGQPGPIQEYEEPIGELHKTELSSMGNDYQAGPEL